MKKSTLLHRISVSVGTLSYLSLCISGAAFAQEVSEEEETVERIQVTGTNIRGANMEGAQPLTVLTSDDIARTRCNHYLRAHAHRNPSTWWCGHI